MNKKDKTNKKIKDIIKDIIIAFEKKQSLNDLEIIEFLDKSTAVLKERYRSLDDNEQENNTIILFFLMIKLMVGRFLKENHGEHTC